MFRFSNSLFVASASPSSAKIVSTTMSKNVTTATGTVSHLASHRFANKPQMTRRPALPRAGNLEPSLLSNPKKSKTTADPRAFNDSRWKSFDAMDTFGGQLDHWRHIIMVPQATSSLYYQHFRGVPPQWEVIVPLLESIREAGRAKFYLQQRDFNVGPSQYVGTGNAASTFFEQQDQQLSQQAAEREGEEKKEAEEAAAAHAQFPLLHLLPTGHRFTPASVSKQFLVELNVRLPLLESTLETTATPLLVARLCKTMRYCGVAVPAVGSFASSSHGVLDTRLRLRALLIAAMRKSEVMLVQDEEERKKRMVADGRGGRGAGEETELRKRRRLTLESTNSSFLFEFLEENKQSLLDCSETQDLQKILVSSTHQAVAGYNVDDEPTISPLLESLRSVLNIDIEKETPRLVSWAQAGKKCFDENLQLDEGDEAKFSMISVAKSQSEPVQWLPGGDRAKSTVKTITESSGAKKEQLLQ